MTMEIKSIVEEKDVGDYTVFHKNGAAELLR